MTFLSPLYLLGALAAAVPVVLHFLHRQPEARVRFAAVRLLRQAPVEDTRKRRLREWLLLALRVTALALIALAFARPFFPIGLGARSEGLTLVALDTSLSMSAPSTFARARELAREAIGRAPSGSLVGLITFADTARVAASPTADRALVLSALDRVAPGFGATRYRAVLNTATELAAAAGSTAPTIVVVTDLQASGWDAGERAAVPDAARVEVADVGAMPPNVAIRSAEIRGDRVVAEATNSGPQARDVHVTLTVDGKRVSEATASVPPGGTSEVELPGARGDTASVSVDDAAGIQGDNTWFLVLGDTSRPHVVVITSSGDLGRDAFYVDQALSAGGSSAPYTVEGAAASAVSTWDAARFSAAAAVVLVSTRGLEAKGRALLADYVRSGGGVFVAAGPDVDSGELSEILGGAVTVSEPAVESAVHAGAARHFAPADLRHPVFRAFAGQAATLGLATFTQIASIQSKACDAVARFTTGEPALVDCGIGKGRALVFASDLDNRGNDFPLRASFVPFVDEALGYLFGPRPRSGAVFVGEAPFGVSSVPGIATVERGGLPTRVAVNVNPAESDPSRISPDEFQGALSKLRQAGRADARLEQTDAENRQHLWQYALLLALVVLTAESVISARAA